MVSRRSLLKIIAATSALPYLGHARLSWADDKKIVIVGGGAAGTIVARYLNKLIPGLQITLIEKNKIYQPAFFSSEIIAGLSLENQAKFSYELLNKSAITLMHNTVTEIDSVTKKISLDNGKTLEYDRLVMATGSSLDFNSIKNYAKEILHAWQAGDQPNALHQQIIAMKQGGTVVFSIPAGDISGSLAPFERVSAIARTLATINTKAKIIFLNAQQKNDVMQAVESAWSELYPGMIDVMYQTEVTEVNKTSVVVSGKEIGGDVFNLVPRNNAGALLQQAGLTDDSTWCPVTFGTFESSLKKSIYVIGDGVKSMHGINKTAQAANAQAKMCAISLAQSIMGKNAFDNMPPLIDSEYCILGENYAFSRTHILKVDAQGKIRIVSDSSSDTGASEKQKGREAMYAASWKKNISQEMFG